MQVTTPVCGLEYVPARHEEQDDDPVEPLTDVLPSGQNEQALVTEL